LNFADLIAPHDPRAFFETTHRKRPLHIAGTPGKFDFSMSWELLNEILDQSAIWTPHTMQLVLDRVTLRPDQYTREGIGRDGRPTLLVDFEKMQGFVRQGATILLADCNTLTPGIKAICDALGREPGGKVQANLYCSWKAHQAFDVHYDVADVFVTQIHGQKVWRIYQQVVKDPVRHPVFTDTSVHREKKGALSAEVVMRPGDVLYIPAGFCHEAIAESGATVHVTYETRLMNGLDVIPLLFERAVHDEAVRAPLPSPETRDGAALDEYLMRLAGRMREMLRDPQMRTELEAQMRNFAYPTQAIKLPDDSGKS
jgi:ribosomal protein L16 Arg81 hydroxylase